MTRILLAIVACGCLHVGLRCLGDFPGVPGVAFASTWGLLAVFALACAVRED